MTEQPDDFEVLLSASLKQLALGLDLPPELTGFSVQWDVSPLDSRLPYGSFTTPPTWRRDAMYAASRLSRDLDIPMDLLGYPSFLDARHQRRAKARIKRKSRR